MQDLVKCRRELVTDLMMSKVFIVLGASLACCVLQCIKDLNQILKGRHSKSLDKASNIQISECSLEFVFTSICLHNDYKFHTMYTVYSYMHWINAIYISTMRMNGRQMFSRCVLEQMLSLCSTVPDTQVLESHEAE